MMTSKSVLYTFLLLLNGFCLDISTAIDTITLSQYIKDPESITSSGGRFKLGFFTPDDSTNRYVGIWYSGVPAINVVWVANRNMPLKDTSGMVRVSDDGNLVVLNGVKEVLWSTNISNSSTNSSAQILDTGNLVMTDESNGNRIWESFQYASDSLLPNMVISSSATSGKRLTSWKSPSDPSVGNFSVGLISLNVTPQLFIWYENKPYWRSGPWNGQLFIGVPGMSSFNMDKFNVAEDSEGTPILSFSNLNKSSLSNFVLKSNGKIEDVYWENGTKEWKSAFIIPQTECDIYGKCGAFGICDAQSSKFCSCLEGFEPKIVEEWNRGNWTSGCMRRKPLQCVRISNGGESGKDDGFLKLKRVKVPDLAEKSASLEDGCKNHCLNSCSCVGYAFDNGIGCMFWNENLIDIQKFYPADTYKGSDLYIRLAYSKLDRKTELKTIIISVVIIGIVTIVICAFFSWRWIAKRKEKTFTERSSNILRRDDMNQAKLEELPLFKLEELSTATNNFNPINKLGQGGFGPVYRGKLHNGQEIAVKRLSRASGQGLEEFMNEVIVISKLQHRNLVKLYGCCVDAEENMLVYEYMPNKSLDAFIFDPAKHDNLNWKQCICIIEGISRGLLYLHRDSRLKIIHRDLKASNILLDEKLNPKISDFGMARIFGSNEDQANTRRVVGTYGYMSPEYAMEGRFSEKSDVYSFGVLLLEIVSGKKISSFYKEERSLSLVGYAWELWKEDNGLDLITPAIFDPCFKSEILRAIHVGLLCVQQYAEDRPTISTVISMLSSEIVDLPSPFQPGFTTRPTEFRQESTQPGETKCSLNNVTLTIVEGR